MLLQKNNKSVIIQHDFLYKNVMRTQWNGFLMRGIDETENFGKRKKQIQNCKNITKKQGSLENTVFFRRLAGFCSERPIAE